MIRSKNGDMLNSNFPASTTMTASLTSVQVVLRDRPGADGLVRDTIEHFLDYSGKWTVEKAACAGYVRLLQILGERQAETSADRMDWCMRVAANDGNLAVIRWLTAYRPEFKTSTRVMDAAAFRGHLEVVQWLHEHRSEGCTVNAMNSAAASGHLHVVQWLHEHRSEGCTTAAMDTAAAGGRLAVVEWLAANRREGCTTTAVDFAIYNGHFAVVKWFSDRSRAARNGDWLIKTPPKLPLAACE
jgi:hypothetical protein